MHNHTFKPAEVVHHVGLLNSGIMDDARKKMMLVDGGPFWCKIFKRQVIFGDESVNKECKVFPENILFTEDNAIASSLKLRIKRLAYIPEPLYFYLQRQGSASHSISERHIRERWLTCHMILDIAQRDGTLQKFLQEFEFVFSSLFCVNTLNWLMPYNFVGKKDFFKNLILEQKRVFPDFQKNFYYQQRIDPSTRGMIELLTEIF